MELETAIEKIDEWLESIKELGIDIDEISSCYTIDVQELNAINQHIYSIVNNIVNIRKELLSQYCIETSNERHQCRCPDCQDYRPIITQIKEVNMPVFDKNPMGVTRIFTNPRTGLMYMVGNNDEILINFFEGSFLGIKQETFNTKEHGESKKLTIILSDPDPNTGEVINYAISFGLYTYTSLFILNRLATVTKKNFNVFLGFNKTSNGKYRLVFVKNRKKFDEMTQYENFKFIKDAKNEADKTKNKQILIKYVDKLYKICREKGIEYDVNSDPLQDPDIEIIDEDEVPF